MLCLTVNRNWNCEVATPEVKLSTMPPLEGKNFIKLQMASPSNKPVDLATAFPMRSPAMLHKVLLGFGVVSPSLPSPENHSNPPRSNLLLTKEVSYPSTQTKPQTVRYPTQAIAPPFRAKLSSL